MQGPGPLLSTRRGPIRRLYLPVAVQTSPTKLLCCCPSNLKALQSQGWSRQPHWQMPLRSRMQLPANVWKRQVRWTLLVPRHPEPNPRIKHPRQSEGDHHLRSIGRGLY